MKKVFIINISRSNLVVEFCPYEEFFQSNYVLEDQKSFSRWKVFYSMKSVLVDEKSFRSNWGVFSRLLDYERREIRLNPWQGNLAT
jgi:hypothetical protein